MVVLFAHINWLAVIAGTLVFLIIGSIWFGPKTMWPVWMRAMDRTIPTERDQISGGEAAVMWGGTLFGGFAQVATLAAIIELGRTATLAGGGSFGWIDGAIYGVLFAAGLGAFGSLPHRLFSQPGSRSYRALRVWLIEVTPDIVALKIAGIILALWAL